MVTKSDSSKQKKIVRRNPGETRARILRTAIKLFGRKGYDGTAVDEIVSAAKVNKRMVYHYFGNKEGLYLAVLQEIYGHLEDLELKVMDDHQDPKETLRYLLSAFFDYLRNNPDFVRLLLWENLNSGRIILKSPRALNKDPFLNRLKVVVAKGQERGEFRAGIDINHLLISMIGLCFIYHSNRYTLSQALNMDLGSNEVLNEGLDSVFELVFRGISAKG